MTNTSTTNPQDFSEHQSQLLSERAIVMERLRSLAIQGILQLANEDGALTIEVEEYVALSKKIKQLREIPVLLKEYAEACYSVAAAEYPEHRITNVSAKLHPQISFPLDNTLEKLTTEAGHLFEQLIDNKHTFQEIIWQYRGFILDNHFTQRSIPQTLFAWLDLFGLRYRLTCGMYATHLASVMQTEYFLDSIKAVYRSELKCCRENIVQLIGSDYALLPSVDLLSEPIDLTKFVNVSNVMEHGHHMVPKEHHEEGLRLFTRLQQLDDTINQIKSKTESSP